jgi:hypothetical protein
LSGHLTSQFAVEGWSDIDAARRRRRADDRNALDIPSRAFTSGPPVSEAAAAH